MWNRVLVGVRISVGIVLIALGFDIPSALGQMEAQREAAFAGCRSAVTFRLPDVNWSNAIVRFEGFASNGYSMFRWSLPANGLSGTCIAGQDGNAAQFTVTSNLVSFQSGPGVPVTEAQLAACRVAANSTLPGLTWSQLNVDPKAYPQGNGDSAIRWSGPGGVPSGTCVGNSNGMVTQFNVNGGGENGGGALSW